MSWHKLLDSDRYDLDGESKFNHVFKKKLNYEDLKRIVLDLDSELNRAYYLKERYQRFNREYMSAEAAEKKLMILFLTFKAVVLRNMMNSPIFLFTGERKLSIHLYAHRLQKEGYPMPRPKL